MPAVIWIVIGAVILAACLGGGGKGSCPAPGGKEKPFRIDRPHAVDADDYECSVCRRRFRKDVMTCPHCGARFTKRVKDEDDLLFELDELDAWDEEDGL